MIHSQCDLCSRRTRECLVCVCARIRCINHSESLVYGCTWSTYRMNISYVCLRTHSCARLIEGDYIFPCANNKSLGSFIELARTHTHTGAQQCGNFCFGSSSFVGWRRETGGGDSMCTRSRSFGRIDCRHRYHNAALCVCARWLLLLLLPRL